MNVTEQTHTVRSSKKDDSEPRRPEQKTPALSDGDQAERIDRIARATALDSILPFDRRDTLAALLTDDDVETLRHLAKQGLGDNSLRALASDLGYLEG